MLAQKSTRLCLFFYVFLPISMVVSISCPSIEDGNMLSRSIALPAEFSPSILGCEFVNGGRCGYQEDVSQNYNEAGPEL
jgi:hypothetical protein